MMLAACAESPERRLPADFGRPVSAPIIKAGDDAVKVAARSLRALSKANAGLVKDRAYGEKVLAE